MTQPAKAQEPSMEEILASIRRIIADDETKPATQVAAEPAKAAPAPAPAKAPPRAAPAPQPAAAPAPAPAAKNSQDEIDAMLAGFDAEPTAPAPRDPEPEPEPAADVFELTEQMAIPEPAAAPPMPARAFQQVEPPDDIEFSEPHVAPRSYQTPAIEPPSYAEPDAPAARPLMSQSTMTSVESAFNSLANTVLSQNARTLEDLVKEMLRPMLKAWIDDNLPNMVERIVRAEIERVSRGR
ncbi:MAG: PopZ family protein [Xanthobacteraceae bacterium]